MVNLPHGQEIQGSLGVRSLLLMSILRLVRLNGLSVIRIRKKVYRNMVEARSDVFDSIERFHGRADMQRWATSVL